MVRSKSDFLRIEQGGALPTGKVERGVTISAPQTVTVLLSSLIYKRVHTGHSSDACYYTKSVM